MNTDVLIKAGIDYEGGVKRFMGRKALYEKLLNKFPKDTTFARIREDYENLDMDGLLRDAHEFKGMCGNVSLPGLFSAAERLVALLRREGFSPDELKDAYDALASGYDAVMKAIAVATEDDAL